MVRSSRCMIHPIDGCCVRYNLFVNCDSISLYAYNVIWFCCFRLEFIEMFRASISACESYTFDSVDLSRKTYFPFFEGDKSRTRRHNCAYTLLVTSPEEHSFCYEEYRCDVEALHASMAAYLSIPGTEISVSALHSDALNKMRVSTKLFGDVLVSRRTCLLQA